ncbi:MAG TPA: 2-dehydro-3-deoxygalactonokinase [Devosiaceae bacterium]|nr:2-dehydro-3-deoxygalactonokinase [Devosiaceae bacterium]
MSSVTAWVAVDWGTTNLRAWGIGPGGEVTFAKSSAQGMGKLAPEGFAKVLAELLADEISGDGPSIDVLICGMAGARQGWMEAPYLEAPADLGGVAFSAVRPSMPDSRLNPRILAGVCQKLASTEDVMRGEETQILGLSALLPGFTGTAVLPGTHSKWIAVNGRRIERFNTVMTGELYEVLRTHSVLRLSLSGDLDGPEREGGFTAGLEAGVAAPQKLAAMLFKVRAGSLLSNRQPDWCAGYLSGLLIGAEIGGQRDWLADGEIPLIGSPGLCGLYAKGLELVGAKSRIVDATEATLAGLKAARSLG